MYYREKDQQLAKLNELQRLQSQQAEHALEDFKSQVERNSSKMFDDMKKQVPVFKELVSKTSYIHLDMLLIFIIDFILQLKKIKIYVFMFVLWVTFICHFQQYVQSD